MTFDISKANVQWVQTKTTNNGRGRKDANAVIVSSMKSGKGNDGRQRYTNAVTIPNEVMEKNRLMKGDRVMVGFSTQNEKNYLILTRTLGGGGYAISKPHATSKNGYVKFGSADCLSKLPFQKHLNCPISTMVMFSNGFAVEVANDEQS